MRYTPLCCGMSWLLLSICASILGAGAGQAPGTEPFSRPRPPYSFGRRDKPPIPMKRAEELNPGWLEAAGRMADDSTTRRKIQEFLKTRTGSLPPSKDLELSSLYEVVRDTGNGLSQNVGARLLLEADMPAVLHELLLHSNGNVVGRACDQLTLGRPKDPAGLAPGTPGASPKDNEAVPFLVFVLDRNNYLQQGESEATLHLVMKRRLLDALLYITDLETQAGKVDIHDEKAIDRVLALARAWAAEKGLEPLEKQRPPKPDPPKEPPPPPGGAPPKGAP